MNPVDEAAIALRAGKIVCFPTETFYGLAVDAMDRAAVDRLVAAKGREEGKPIAVIVPDLAAAWAIWTELPEPLRELAEQHWPGPLTIVAPSSAACAIQPTVGARVSPHPIARALALAFGGPITATSANLAGQPAARTVDDARAQLGDRVDVYLDGGETPGGQPSTVVGLVDGRVTVLRPGALRL